MRTYFLCIALLVSMSFCNAQNNSSSKNNISESEFLRLQNVENYIPYTEAYRESWDVINENDVTWTKRVYRTLKIEDNYLLSSQFLGQSFSSILFDGLLQNKFTGYSAIDSRFTENISDDVIAQIAKMDKDKVIEFRIKEDWLYIENEQKLIVRIIGIAPLSSDVDDNESQPICWLYYPQLREYLSSIKTKTADQSKDNLDKIFYGHYFVSSVNKS